MESEVFLELTDYRSGGAEPSELALLPLANKLLQEELARAVGAACSPRCNNADQQKNK